MTRASALAAPVLALVLVAACGKIADPECQNPRVMAEASARVVAAQTDAEAKTDHARAQAEHEVEEAKARFVQLRDYFHSTTTKLFAIDKKIAEVEARAKTPAGHGNADLEGTLKRLHAGRDRFTSDFEALETTLPATWADTKARLDRELSDLQTIVDDA
jgi:septal ring factor EnvC (AmiA/AmiB activator)